MYNGSFACNEQAVPLLAGHKTQKTVLNFAAVARSDMQSNSATFRPNIS
jgi:hypothetical protein